MGAFSVLNIPSGEEFAAFLCVGVMIGFSVHFDVIFRLNINHFHTLVRQHRLTKAPHIIHRGLLSPGIGEMSVVIQTHVAGPLAQIGALYNVVVTAEEGNDVGRTELIVRPLLV